MAQFFKSKTFIVLLCVALVAVIVPSVLSAVGAGFAVRDAVNTVLTPVRSFFVWIGDGIGGFFEYFGEFDRIRAENDELRIKLEQANDQLYAARVAGEENEWLRSFLGLRREHTDYRFQDAMIVGRESGNYMTVFTLNAGTLQGVAVNMPVVTERGVVGAVTEVGLTWSKATTVIEYGSSVGVYCERSGAIGIAEGTYELRSRSLCRVNYLDATADVAVGDRFFTSGLGNVYPRGMCLGEVSRIYADEYGRGMIAELAPAVDLSSLSRVMIVTSYESVADAPPASSAETEAAA